MLEALLPTRRRVITFGSVLLVLFSLTFATVGPVFAQSYANEVPIAPTEINSGCGLTLNGLLHCIVINFLGSVVGIAGSFFDMSISVFIIDFGDLYLTTNLGYTIDNTWASVRDIFNLAFIFGLLYIGFQIILGSHEHEAKRTIPYLILAALLVNFSLFVVKFIIDFANLLAVQVYNLFKFNTAPADGMSGVIDPSTIGTAFISVLGMSQVLSLLPSDTTSTLYLLGTFVLFLILIYVFLAGAIMVTVRFAMLLMYLVFSPVMFIGWVFPSMKKHSDSYFEGLLGQAFFAPVFIFMLFLSYALLANFNSSIRGSGIDLLNTSDDSNDNTVADAFTTLVPFFALTVVFLLASMTVAKSMATKGSKYSVNAFNKMNKWGTNAFMASTYPLRAAPRMALNAAGERAEKGFNNLQTRKGVLGSIARWNATDRVVRAGTQKAAKAELATGTYNKAEKEYQKGVKKQAATTRSANDLATAIKVGSADSALPEEKIAMEEAVQHATSEQIITALDKAGSDTSKYANIVGSLSNSQVSKLLDMKDDEFNPDKKSKLLAARRTTINSRVTGLSISPTANTPEEKLREGFGKASTDDLYGLGYETLMANAAYIPAAKMDDLKGKLTHTQYQNLDTQRKSDLKSLFDAPATRESVFKGKKDSEIARLPKTILTDPNVVQHLNPRILDIILRENYLAKEDREVIVTNINNAGMIALHNWLATPQGTGF